MNAYENLANAIILQAVKDYRNARHKGTKAEIEQFFRSEWFEILTDLDGKKLIEDLRRESGWK